MSEDESSDDEEILSEDEDVNPLDADKTNAVTTTTAEAPAEASLAEGVGTSEPAGEVADVDEESEIGSDASESDAEVCFLYSSSSGRYVRLF